MARRPATGESAPDFKGGPEMSRRKDVPRSASRTRSRQPAKRSYNTCLIKRDFSYSVHEIADLYALHPQAIRRWIKHGLRRIDDRRPILIHGTDLIEFLETRQKARKRRCRHDEFYCCRCREARRAKYNQVVIEIRNRRQLNISASCELCGTCMNRAGTVCRIAEYAKTFVALTVLDRRIDDRARAPVTCHLDEERSDAPLQPQE
jgi:hypothetical protein